MADLGISFDQWKPLARRVVASLPGYPWSDGVHIQPKEVSNETPQQVLPVFQGRNPRIWPDNFDYRHGIYLPWGRRHAIPSPAAWEATCHVAKSSTHWDAEDDGQTVIFIPDADPSNPAAVVRWKSDGLVGGDVVVETGYVNSLDADTEFPAGSLQINSRANPKGSTDWWISPTRKYTTFQSYDGPNVHWGPMSADQFELDTTGTDCNSIVVILFWSFEFFQSEDAYSPFPTTAWFVPQDQFMVIDESGGSAQTMIHFQDLASENGRMDRISLMFSIRPGGELGSRVIQLAPQSQRINDVPRLPLHFFVPDEYRQSDDDFVADIDCFTDSAFYEPIDMYAELWTDLGTEGELAWSFILRLQLQKL